MNELVTRQPGQLATAPRSALSPDVAAARPLGDLVESFALAAGRSKATHRAYTMAAGLFLEYFGEQLQRLGVELERPLAERRPDATDRRKRRKLWHYADPADGGRCGLLRLVTPAHVDGFTAWREEEGDSPATVEQRRAAVVTLLRVALRDGVLTPEQGQALAIEPYKARRRRSRTVTGRRLSRQEARDLRQALRADGLKAIRDAAIVDCMLFAGLRRAEVARLRVGSLQQDTGRYWLLVEGKGAKQRKVKVHDQLYQSLTRWIDAAGAALQHERPLFVGVTRHGRLTGKAVNGDTIARVVAAAGAAARLAPPGGRQRLSPHDLRRTCARNAHDNGASLLRVQRMLGHASPDTTADYIGLNDGDGKSAVDWIEY